MLHSLESHGACICSMANLILSFFLFCTLGDFIVKLKHRRPKQLICPFNLHPPITKSNMVHHELTNFNFKMSHIPDLVTYSEDIYVHYRKWYTSNITYSSFDRKCLIPQNDFIAQYNVIFMPWQHYPSDSRRGWMRLNNEQNVMTEELSVTKEAPNAILLYYIFIFFIFSVIPQQYLLQYAKVFLFTNFSKWKCFLEPSAVTHSVPLWQTYRTTDKKQKTSNVLTDNVTKFPSSLDD